VALRGQSSGLLQGTTHASIVIIDTGSSSNSSSSSSSSIIIISHLKVRKQQSCGHAQSMVAHIQACVMQLATAAPMKKKMVVRSGNCAIGNGDDDRWKKAVATTPGTQLLRMWGATVCVTPLADHCRQSYDETARVQLDC
jgi:hypothetical protein